jgi:hypothetical protein
LVPSAPGENDGRNRRAGARRDGSDGSDGARMPRASRAIRMTEVPLRRSGRRALRWQGPRPPIVSEAVDKWVFDTFNQLFPPCGPGTPNQTKMLCGCDPTNPEHYVRLGGDVEPALKAKDRADGTAFTKGLSPSKVAAILARFGLQPPKQSAINADTCKAHGFRHSTIPKGSALFGRKPIQGGGGAAASAAGAATAAGASGAAIPGAANPGAAAGGAAGVAAAGGASAVALSGNAAGGDGVVAPPMAAASSAAASSIKWAPIESLGPPRAVAAGPPAGQAVRVSGNGGGGMAPSATSPALSGNAGGGGGAAAMAGGVASGGAVASRASSSTGPCESYKDPVPCGARCGKECERGTRCTCGALANGRELRQDIERQQGQYAEEDGSHGSESDDESPDDRTALAARKQSMPPPPPTTPVAPPCVQTNNASAASQHTASNAQPGSSSGARMLPPFQPRISTPPQPQLVDAMAGKIPSSTATPAAGNAVSPMTGGARQPTTSKANGVSPVRGPNLGGGDGGGSSSRSAPPPTAASQSSVGQSADGGAEDSSAGGGANGEGAEVDLSDPNLNTPEALEFLVDWLFPAAAPAAVAGNARSAAEPSGLFAGAAATLAADAGGDQLGACAVGLLEEQRNRDDSVSAAASALDFADGVICISEVETERGHSCLQLAEAQLVVAIGVPCQ